MDPGSHLDLSGRLLPSAIWALHRVAAVPASTGGALVSLSGPAVLAPSAGRDVWSLCTDLGGKRSGVDEPLGLSRQYWRQLRGRQFDRSTDFGTSGTTGTALLASRITAA